MAVFYEKQYCDDFMDSYRVIFKYQYIGIFSHYFIALKAHLSIWKAHLSIWRPHEPWHCSIALVVVGTFVKLTEKDQSSAKSPNLSDKLVCHPLKRGHWCLFLTANVCACVLLFLLNYLGFLHKSTGSVFYVWYKNISSCTIYQFNFLNWNP